MKLHAHLDVKTYRQFYEAVGREYDEEAEVYTHPLGRWRHRVILELSKPYAARGWRMLDAGCGSGLYAIPYAQLGGYVVGVDLSPNNVARAQHRAKAANCEAHCNFVVGDIGQVNWPEAFNLVLCSETLEYVLEPDATLGNLSKSLRPGGHLILTTPNKHAVTLANLLVQRWHLPARWFSKGTSIAMRFEYPGSLLRFMMCLLLERPYVVKTNWVVDTEHLIDTPNMPAALYIHRAYTPYELVQMLPTDQYKILQARTCVYYPLPSQLSTGRVAFAIEKALGLLPIVKHLGVHSLVIAQKKSGS